MPYTATIQKRIPKPPDELTLLKSEVAHLKEELDTLHKTYQKNANRKLQEMVERERAHMQAQLDAEVVRANEAINQANALVELVKQDLDDLIRSNDEMMELLAKNTADFERVLAEKDKEIKRLNVALSNKKKHDQKKTKRYKAIDDLEG